MGNSNNTGQLKKNNLILKQYLFYGNKYWMVLLLNSLLF